MQAFPRSFTLQKASTFGSNLTILDPNGNPLYYVAHHSGLFAMGKPDVSLRTTPDKSSPELASAKFHAIGSSIDINITNGLNVKIHHSGVLHRIWSFDFALPNGQMEHFEWKNSSGAEVASLGGRSHGLKLVRASTGEVIAAETDVRMSWSKKSKFGFVSREMLGSKLELMVVISMLAVTEKLNREAAASSAAGAASSA